MQLSLIDPRQHPVATAAMLDDPLLRGAIGYMRRWEDSPGNGWPCVEHLVEVGGRPAWAVDDLGVRYVVCGHIIFRLEEFGFMDEKIRTAAMAAYERLDASAASSSAPR